VSEIRSYRRVFDLERRIYAIDRVRLNPGGVPVRGIVYAAAVAVVLAMLSRIPLLGRPLAAIPWLLRDLALPAATGALMSVIRMDGRSCHLTLTGVAGFARGPRRLVALRPVGAGSARWLPGALIALPGATEGGARRLRYRGPGVVMLAAPSRSRDTRFVARSRARGGRGRVVAGEGAAGTRSISVRRRRAIVLVPSAEIVDERIA
jgi:hypothetical protein